MQIVAYPHAENTGRLLMESLGIIAIIVVLVGSIIFIHELGHFVAAKLIGVKVITFSLGFGKRLWQRKIGETTFCLSMVPFGGYVLPASGPNPTVGPNHKSPKILRAIGQFSEEELAEIEKSSTASHGTLAHASFWGKMFFYTNGLIFNVLSAYLVIFAYFYCAFVTKYTDPNLIVESVKADSAVGVAGLLPGDRIVVWDGKESPAISEIKSSLKANVNDAPIPILVNRDGERLAFTIVPKRVVSPGSGKSKRHVGFQLAGTKGKPPIGLVASESAVFIGTTFKEISLNMLSLTGVYKAKNQGKNSNEEIESFNFVGGMVQLGVVASQDLLNFLTYFVLLSISIVILNALPIPACDGSQILVHLVEGIRGKPVPFVVKERLSCCGLYLMLALFGFSIVMDAYEVVSRLIS
ncbi:M50 family metallopeptidase [Pirellulaceae bacterium SH449]